jgi:hypothetical protein
MIQTADWLRSARTRAIACVACIAVCVAPAAHAREIGRLFFTPDQRASLERNRLAPPAPEAAKPAPPPVLGSVSVNGIVTRSSGRSTTWVNGVARNDTLKPANDTVRVPVGESTRRTVPLRVGETFEGTTGERRDLLGGGSISVKRAP